MDGSTSLPTPFGSVLQLLAWFGHLRTMWSVPGPKAPRGAVQQASASLPCVSSSARNRRSTSAGEVVIGQRPFGRVTPSSDYKFSKSRLLLW